MNKSDLIELISSKENLTLKQAADIVDLIFDRFADTLAKGGRIELRGFGSFSVRGYKSYSGRNPKTGSSIDVRPKKMAFFKVGKELKEKVNSAE